MKRFDIPFATDDAHAFLPWVLGVMACLTALLLCLGITLGGWITDRHHSYTASFTVNIPAGIDDPHTVTKIEDALRAVPGITGISEISQSNLRDMLKPWLGGADVTANLPLPVVLTVAVNNAIAINYSELQTKLTQITPGIDIDAHERWIANFIHFSTALQWTLSILAALIVGSLALMIAFTSRAALKLHAKTVQLLHSIGAEDRYIVRQFQREGILLTLRGTAPGCFAAGLVYWLGGRYVTSLQSSILPAFAMTDRHLELLLLLPLACTIVAWTAARLSVTRQLQHVL